MKKGDMDDHTLNALAAQRLLCKLSDDRRLMEPPLSAFRPTAHPRPPMDYMNVAF
jgi:hypothetical protein